MISCLNIECFLGSSASIDPLEELRYFRVVPDLQRSAAFFPFHRDPVQSRGNTRDEFRDDELLETLNKSIHKRDPRSPSEVRALGEADLRAVPKNVTFSHWVSYPGNRDPTTQGDVGFLQCAST